MCRPAVCLCAVALPSADICLKNLSRFPECSRLSSQRFRVQLFDSMESVTSHTKTNPRLSKLEAERNLMNKQEGE